MNNTNQFRTPDFDALLNLQLEVPSEKRKPEFGLSQDSISGATQIFDIDLEILNGV